MICLQCAVKRTTLHRCVKPSSVAVPCLLSIQWAIWPKIHKSLFNNFTSSNCEICCIQRLSSISSLRIFWTWMIYHSHRSKKRFLEAISLDACKWVVVFPCPSLHFAQQQKINQQLNIYNFTWMASVPEAACAKAKKFQQFALPIKLPNFSDGKIMHANCY